MVSVSYKKGVIFMAHLSLEERETIESNLKDQKNFTQISETGFMSSF